MGSWALPALTKVGKTGVEMTTTTRRRLIVLAYAAVLVLVTLAAMTFAEAALKRVMVSVDINNVVRGAEGEIKPARDPIPVADLGLAVGQVCVVGLEGFNPGSEHDGNDLILGTGGATLVAPNFEEFTGKVTAVEAVMTLGEYVTFDVLLGEDEVSSGGLTATFDCPPPEPPTTTTTVAPTTTTTVAPTTTTTTTLPPTTTTTMEDWPTTTTTTTLPPTTTTTIGEPPGSTTSTTETPVGAVPAGGGACAAGACVVAVSTTWSGWQSWAAIVFGVLALVLGAATVWGLRRKSN